MEPIKERRMKDEDENLICCHFRSPVGFELIIVTGNTTAGIPS
jgi:hypothetical protein